MEGPIAGALYVAEHIVEAGAAAYKGLTLSTAPLNATFTKLRAPSLPRSSHTVSVIGNKAYIFGGEITPRKPVDNDMHIVTLPSTALTEADYQSIPARPEKAEGQVPIARVGHTASIIDKSIFIFGGRGGPDMKALEENGRIWVYDTRMNTWSHIDPRPDSPVAPARSYHTSAATSHPEPKPSNTDSSSHNQTSTPNIPEPPNAPVSSGPPTDTLEPPPEGTYGTLFIHAGCLSSGGRTSDLWSFDLHSRSWAELPSAPDPGRGGTSLAIVRNRLYRFGGFDGTTELGGQVDFLDLNLNDEFNDKGGTGVMAVGPQGEWRANVFAPEAQKDGKGGNKTAPGYRSVCGFSPVSTGQGREYLLIICGEGTASSQGHEGAGKFYDDVWSFRLKPEGATAGAVKDATRSAIMGKKTGEADVVEVKYYAGEGSQETVAGDTPVGSKGESEGRSVSLGEGGGRMIQEGQPKPMGRRGWFATAPMGEVGGNNSVLVHGGVGEDNERMGDIWVVSVE